MSVKLHKIHALVRENTMMKTAILFCVLILFPAAGAAQGTEIPASYLRDSLPALVQRCQDLLDHSYMAQTLLSRTDSLPGWEGYTVSLYEYKTGTDIYTGKPKIGKVYLCNPTPEKLAMWIITTCWEVKQSVDYQYTYQLLRAIRHASGAQYPVLGTVYEDQYTAGFQEPYVFKDGVTVYVKDSAYVAKNAIATDKQMEYYLHLTNADLQRTGQYGRIVSTTREEYTKNGGTADVGDAKNRKFEWLNVVRDLYKKALRSDKNELIIAWAKHNLN